MTGFYTICQMAVDQKPTTLADFRSMKYARVSFDK
jgi:hypothetical protein